MATHTPGPWLARKARPTFPHPIRAGENENAPIVATAAVQDISYAEAEANARLIAASPELLAALRGALDALLNETFGQKLTPWVTGVVKNAHAAIAKATGEN